jgi:hypothetical protein
MLFPLFRHFAGVIRNSKSQITTTTVSGFLLFLTPGTSISHETFRFRAMNVSYIGGVCPLEGKVLSISASCQGSCGVF